MGVLAVKYLAGNAVANESWLKDRYQQAGLDYPKFHKMDSLSKMALLLTEELVTEHTQLDFEQTCLLFANTHASSATDIKFIESYTKYQSPSPSLFVYTLPNIVTGELSIKYKWFGENTFFIAPRFDAAFFAEQIELSRLNGNRLFLCGWTEDHPETQQQECFLFLVDDKLNDSDIEELNHRYKLHNHE